MNLLYPVPTGPSSLFVHLLEAPDVLPRMSTIRTEQVKFGALVCVDGATVDFRNRRRWTDVANLNVYEYALAGPMRRASQYPLIHNSYTSRKRPHLAPDILDQVVR